MRYFNTCIFLLICFTFGLFCCTVQPKSDYTAYRTALEHIGDSSMYCRIVLFDSIVPKYGFDSKERLLIEKEMQRFDSLDLVKVLALKKHYGFPAYSKVGEQAGNNAFLAIQHADAKTRKAFLPELVRAAKKCEASLYNVALMQDRVRMDDGKKQLYGTQYMRKTLPDGSTVDYVCPIEDYANVDKRRIKMGLDSFHVFLKKMELTYDPAGN